MGAKYYPTIKDQKANLRFQQKQKAQTKAKNPPAAVPVKKDGKK